MGSIANILGLGKSGISTSRLASITDIHNARFKDSKIGFTKKFSNTAEWEKSIGKTTRVRGAIVNAKELRNDFADFFKKRGGGAVSGKYLDKMLQEKYKMNLKDRKRVMQTLAKKYVNIDRQTFSTEEIKKNVKLSQLASELAGGNSPYRSVAGKKQDERTRDGVKDKFGTSGAKKGQADSSRILREDQQKKYGIAFQSGQTYSEGEMRGISASTNRNKQNQKFVLGSGDNIVKVAGDFGIKKPGNTDTMSMFAPFSRGNKY